MPNNLERAWRHHPESDETLRQGATLMYKELTRLLQKEGVSRSILSGTTR